MKTKEQMKAEIIEKVENCDCIQTLSVVLVILSRKK